MDVRPALTTRVLEVLDKAISIFGIAIPPVRVEFFFKGKSHGSAGRRKDGSYYVKLNLLAAQADMNEMMDDTIPHEVAHIVCFVNPMLGRNHDRGWQRVCMKLGGNPSRVCKNSVANAAIVPARVVSKYQYRATCGTVLTVTAHMHGKIMRGKNYRVNKTGGRITAEGCLGRLAR